MRSAIPARKGQIRNSDKGTVVWAASTYCGKGKDCSLIGMLSLSLLPSATARLTPEPGVCLSDGAPDLSPGLELSLQEQDWGSYVDQDWDNQRLMDLEPGEVWIRRLALSLLWLSGQSRGWTGKVKMFFVVSCESNFVSQTRLLTPFSCHRRSVELGNVSKDLSGFLRKKD